MLKLMKAPSTNGCVDLTLRVPEQDSERVERAIQALLERLSPTHFADDGTYSPEQVFGPREPGRIMRGLRAREGWTQEELAARLETSKTVVCDLERGRRPVSKKMAVKLGELFTIPHTVFL
jgi:ribosome-binding protein aMBF1 (putative translation factor)